MAAEYGVYTLAEIFNQIYGHLPSSSSELGVVRSFIEQLGGMPVSNTSINQYFMPNDFFAKTAYTGSQALTVPAQSASSAWGVYKDAQGAISQLTGGATQGGQMVKSAEIGYFRFPEAQSPTGYNYSPAVLLKTPLPTVAAAVAPLAGVAIGATMYADNPELWTKLSRALIPWAYPDGPDGGPPVDFSKGLMPVWTEAAEAAGELIARALVPAPLVDAIKNLFEEEGIGGDPDVGSYTSGYITGEAAGASGASYYASGNTYELMPGVVATRVGNITLYASDSSGYAQKRTYNGNTYYESSMSNSVVHDGQRAYYYSASSGINPYGLPSTPNTAGSLANIAWTLIYGTRHGSGEYPPGTSQWGDGTVYPLPTSPKQIVLQDENGDYHYIDAYPIPMPTTPGQSIDPTIQGIDDPLVDISKQIDPYIQPTPDPYGDPSPSPDPTGQPDPRADPSQKSEPSNPISPSSPTPEPPPSDGSSPDPTPPIIPPPFTSEGGLIAVYNPPQSTLIAFANWLWVTYQDATIQKIWNNPFDGVISLHELYCTPPVIGTRNIKSGFLDSGISSPIIARYTEINCGSIVIPEYWSNYLDYAPYTKAFVYLPFIGIIELEADDIVGHAVNILYRIDCYNGSCIAMITVAKQGPSGETYNNTVYQFSGNCAVELPLTGGTQAAIKAAVINASAWGLGSVINGIMTAIGGRPLSGIGQAVSGAMEATASVVNAKSSVQHSGTFGASFGAMGIKRPYIIVKRPIQVQVLNYNEIYGYQAHKAVTIGSCEGYLRCREVHVTSATANDEEKQLIEQYLKTGVIV